MGMASRPNPKRRAPAGAVLDRMIEEAIVDAYGESEQRVAFFTILEENLRVPFQTEILGFPTTVERLAMTDDDQIVAICRRGRSRQTAPILDLPLPKPLPGGAEWIAAYRRWARGGTRYNGTKFRVGLLLGGT